MSSESPATVLYSSDGYELAVVNASSIPASTRGLLIEGSDGTNSRFITVDSSGRVTIVGAGIAGTPAGGVLSIQGVSGGQPVPISGSVTFTDPAEGSTGSAVPATAIYIGADVVSSPPTLSAGNLAGLTVTTAGRLIIDGSQVTQPVSGTVTANIGTTNGLALDSSVNGILLAQGSTTSGEKGPLVQGAVTTAAPSYTTGQTSPLSLTTTGLLRVDGSGVTQPVSGTVTANAGTGNFTVVQATASNLNAAVVGVGTAGTPSGGVLTVQGSSSGTPIPVTAITNKAGTSAVTTVAASTSSVNILAANSNRIGAAIYNDGSGRMYIKLGTTASTSSFTILLMPNSYWELPNDYTGNIDAIWDRTGANARVTELTA